MRRDPLINISDDSDAHMICAVSIARRVCGPEAARKLVRDFAGTRIFIPKALSPDHPLSKSIGCAQARKLSAECSGMTCYIPMSASGRANRRRALVHHLIGEGSTLPEIARATGHTERTIQRDIAALRNEGLQIDPKRHLTNHWNRKKTSNDHQ